MQQVHILYFTQAGAQLAASLSKGLSPEVPADSTCGKGCLQEWTKEHFQKGNVLVYIGASGIAVRAVAPLLRGKDTDPAVLVMDERGRNVIPLLSGHLGGANEWARRLAKITGGQAVLTTATDVNGLFAVDVFARDNDLVIDDLGKAASFSADLLREKSARVIVPDKYADLIMISGEAPGELQVEYSSEVHQGGNTVLISPDLADSEGLLQLVPKCVVLGIGCRKGKSFEQLRDFAAEALQELGLKRLNVNLSPIQCRDIHMAERICRIAQHHHIPLRSFCFEITESALSYEARLQQNIDMLMAQGATISLDDFGTGYSNLMRVLKFPFEDVKLDMTFVRAYFDHTNKLLPAIIDGFQSFGVQITAEGVENKQMADTLTSLGCRILQGFYFAKPLPLDDFLHYLKTTTPKVSSTID